MANKYIQATDIRNGAHRKVEIAVGAAEAGYIDSHESVLLLSVGFGNQWSQELALEEAAALELASTIMARLGEQKARRIAA